jgi:hypothetical protein
MLHHDELARPAIQESGKSGIPARHRQTPLPIPRQISPYLHPIPPQPKPNQQDTNASPFNPKKLHTTMKSRCLMIFP